MFEARPYLCFWTIRHYIILCLNINSEWIWKIIFNFINWQKVLDLIPQSSHLEFLWYFCMSVGLWQLRRTYYFALDFRYLTLKFYWLKIFCFLLYFFYWFNVILTLHLLNFQVRWYQEGLIFLLTWRLWMQ
jgi:hypothetical protein